MRILVLNGSPKRERSDTMHITRAFLDGIGQTGDHEITTIHVIDKCIKYCSGCFTCKRNGGTCIYDDDMKEVLDLILENDVLLFSFPLYNYGIPAPLKALLDRTMPLSSLAVRKVGDRYHHVGNADFSHMKYVMICGCGFPNSTNNFEPAVAEFKLMFPDSHTLITVPESPMFNAPEASEVTAPRLELVREAGREFGTDGKINDDLLSEICSPMIPEEVYAAIVNSDVSASD